MELRNQRYDFIDLGCGRSCGGMDRAVGSLGGQEGVGVDLNPNCVDIAVEAGRRVMIGDVRKRQPFPNKYFRFAVMMHILEHMANLAQVRHVLGEARRLARDFLFINGPCFDFEYDLADQGFKFYWADWADHPLHMTSRQLGLVLLEEGVERFEIYGTHPATSSQDRDVLPIATSGDMSPYDAKVHGVRKTWEFNPALPKMFTCFAWLREGVDRTVARGVATGGRLLLRRGCG